MIRISSRLTLFFKRVFPVLWFGLLAVFLVAIVWDSAFERSAVVLAAPVLAAVIGLVVFRKLIWGLVDEVYDCGDFLVVRNRGDEERIPLSKIVSVSDWLWMNPPRVTLELSHPGKFGNEIVFLPKFRFALKPFARYPITQDLIDRTAPPQASQVSNPCN